MGKTVGKVIDDGLLTFEFKNKDGEIFSSFRINPTDASLAVRCEKAAEEFNALQNNAPEGATINDLVEHDKKIAEIFNFLLGYEASESIFVKPMTPTTVLPNGDIFSVMVMEEIIAIVEPEIKKRNDKLQNNLNKYLDKYKK